MSVADELGLLEPILHRPELQGSTRDQLAKYLTDNFFEITSTGYLYSRDEVLDTMTAFHATAHDSDLVEDLVVVPLIDGAWIAHYRLVQPGRITLRATIWHRRGDGWAASFHQGTRAAEEV